jgi:AhpD family alkylhydroperoxidase
LDVAVRARIPLVEGEPQDPATAEVFARFAAEGREPIALYRALANAPGLLREYSDLARWLRYEAATPRALRELVILRTAQLTRSEYEWAHHRPMALAAGVSERQIGELARWPESDAFDERERAALRLAEELNEVETANATLEELRRLFGTAETVELIALAALYQAVARMLQALGVEVEPEYRAYLD